MAMLRSRRLAAGKISQADLQEREGVEPRAAYTLYTVPANFRAILRESRLSTLQAIPASRLEMYVQLSGGELVTVAFDIAEIDVYSHVLVGDLVMNPGDSILIYMTWPTLFYYLSGAELPLVSVP